MHRRTRPVIAFAVAAVMVVFLALIVATEGPAYAKGPVKSSGGGSSSGSDSRSSSGSGSSRSSDSGSNRSSNSGSSQSGSSSSSRSGSSTGRSSIESRVYQSPSSRSSTNSLDDSFYLRTPSSRNDSKRPAPTYRKDYADIGDLWKNRQEKRDPRSSAGSWGRSDGRSDGRYYGRDDRWRDSRSWGFSLYTSPFRFSYYCYDYRPTMCYPSPYCFYYDYYPPYVFYHRVTVIPRPVSRVYVEVPVFVYRSSSDYYLTNPADKSLWAVLRNVQLAWERSDVERMMQYVDRNGNVDIYLHDEYTYSVNRLDYYEMTLDAMLAIKTKTFDFDRVNRVDNWRYEANGTHVYTDRYGTLKTVYITYTFERRGSQWFITAVGTSTRPM